MPRSGPNMRRAVAAIRETVEETAVPVGLAPLPDRETVLELQSELAREGDFAALLARGRAELDLASADAVRALGPQIPRRAAVRHDVLRRGLPAGRMAAERRRA